MIWALNYSNVLLFLFSSGNGIVSVKEVRYLVRLLTIEKHSNVSNITYFDVIIPITGFWMHQNAPYASKCDSKLTGYVFTNINCDTNGILL